MLRPELRPEQRCKATYSREIVPPTERATYGSEEKQNGATTESDMNEFTVIGSISCIPTCPIRTICFATGGATPEEAVVSADNAIADFLIPDCPQVLKYRRDNLDKPIPREIFPEPAIL